MRFELVDEIISNKGVTKLDTLGETKINENASANTSDFQFKLLSIPKIEDDNFHSIMMFYEVRGLKKLCQ